MAVSDMHELWEGVNKTFERRLKSLLTQYQVIMSKLKKSREQFLIDIQREIKNFSVNNLKPTKLSANKFITESYNKQVQRLLYFSQNPEADVQPQLSGSTMKKEEHSVQKQTSYTEDQKLKDLEKFILSSQIKTSKSQKLVSGQKLFKHNSEQNLAE